LDDWLTIQQIRGREGIRVRESYARASRETSVAWHGRSYKSANWAAADPINRALSCANSCLYGICHAAIVSAGYSPALGFIHTGKVLSFVYDIADLYKADLTTPVAFQAVAESTVGLESRVRRTCRDAFHEQHLLQRIVPDIDWVLSVERDAEGLPDVDVDADDALPGGLWDPDAGEVAGGVNRADELDGGL